MSRDATQQPEPGKDAPQPAKPGDSATTAPLSDTENAKRVVELMMYKKSMDSVIDAVNQDGLWKNRSKYSGEKLAEQGKELETRFKAALQEQLAKQSRKSRSASISAKENPRAHSVALRGIAVVVAAYPLMGFSVSLASLLTQLGPADDAVRLMASLMLGTLILTIGGFISHSGLPSRSA